MRAAPRSFICTGAIPGVLRVCACIPRVACRPHPRDAGETKTAQQAKSGIRPIHFTCRIMLRLYAFLCMQFLFRTPRVFLQPLLLTVPPIAGAFGTALNPKTASEERRAATMAETRRARRVSTSGAATSASISGAATSAQPQQSANNTLSLVDVPELSWHRISSGLTATCHGRVVWCCKQLQHSVLTPILEPKNAAAHVFAEAPSTEWAGSRDVTPAGRSIWCGCRSRD